MKLYDRGLGCLLLLGAAYFTLQAFADSIGVSVYRVMNWVLTLGVICLVWPFIKRILQGFGWLAGKGMEAKLSSQSSNKPEGFALWLGKTTGRLAAQAHSGGARKGQHVWLTLPDAAQNICVMGGIGSGKTTRVVQPVLNQLMSQDCGGLIFDIKGDFGRAVYTLAANNRREIKTIGVGHQGINLLEGLQPEMAASFLNSAFLLSGQDDGIWVQAATNLSRNALGVLWYIPGAYTLEGLYNFVFSDVDRQDYLEKAADRLADLDDREGRILQSYIRGYEKTHAEMTDKIRNSVEFTIGPILQKFTHPDLADAFCSEPFGRYNLETVLAGDLFLLDLPLSIWGESAKTVYTILKLRFFNIVQQRPAHRDWNQTRPVVFVCDEYQNAISAATDGLSDLNFWDKSRSANCIGIISGQSYNSFLAAVKGQNSAALVDTILQNFRQKVFFRTEDLGTLRYIQELAGKAEVQRVTENKQSGSSYGSHFSNSSGEGTSTVWTERHPVDAQLFRSLGPNQAVAFLNVNGRAFDDVVELQPLFVN